jgi:hypothetical protein
MDDAQFVEKLKAKGLDKLQKASELADQSDPDMPFVLEAIKQLKAPPAPQKTFDPTTRQQRIDAGNLPLPRHGLVQGAEDTVKGLAGGVYSGVPGLAPTLEAVGELSDTLVPGQDPRFNIMPRPGQIHRAMAESPQGFEASSALGASVPLAGSAGLLGQAVQRGSNAALAPAARVYQNLAGQRAPGLIRTVGAGAGTGAAIGAVEAGIRRVPAVAGAEVAPLGLSEVGNEIVLPAFMSGVSSGLPGAVSWATNPRTQTGGTANTFARDKASGAHQQEPLAGLMEGQAGIKQAAEMADKSYADQFPPLKRPVEAAARRRVGELERGLEGLKGDAKRARGAAGAAVEPEIQSGIQRQRAAAMDEFHGMLNQLENEGVKLPKAGLKEALREIVASQASSDTANTKTRVERKTGLLDASGNPVSSVKEGAPGSGEVHTPYGETLAKIEALADRYLPEQATVGDYRNFLKYTKAMADSGTAEKSFPFKEIVGAVREQMGRAEPRLAEANQKYASTLAPLERIKDTVYGDPDLHDLGTRTSPGEFDVPEAGAPLVNQQMTPTQQRRGATSLVELFDKSVVGGARSKMLKEMEDAGFGPKLRDLQGQLDGIEQMSYETKQKHDDAVARVKGEVEDQLREISRDLLPQTDAILESKVAQEASQLRFGKLVRPITEAALGAASHSPAYAGARGADAATKIGSRIGQPVASAIASRAPDAEAMRSSIPGMTGVSTSIPNNTSFEREAAKARKRIASTSQELIDAARGHSAQSR